MAQRWHSVRALVVKRPKQRRAGDSHPNSNTSPDGHGTAKSRQVVDGVSRSGGLCEAIPTELNSMVDNCGWESWGTQEVQEERHHWSSVVVSCNGWGDSSPGPWTGMSEYWKAYIMEARMLLSTSFRLCYSWLMWWRRYCSYHNEPINQPRGRWEFFFVSSLTVNSHMQGACSDLSSTYSPRPNLLSLPDSHSNSNLDHCHHVNTGTLSIMYFNAHSLIPKFDELCLLV